MANYFAANEPEAFILYGDLAFVTTAGYFDPLLCNGAIRCQADGHITVPDLPDLNEAWISADFHPHVANTYPYAQVSPVQLGSGSTAHFRLTSIPNSSSVYSLDYSVNGTTWIPIGAQFGLLAKRVKFSFHVKVHPTNGWLRFYLDKVLVREYAGDTSWFGPLNFVRFSGRNHTTGDLAAASWSQIIVSDTDNRERKVATLKVTGAGASSGWTGTFADVNDGLDKDGLTRIASDTAGQVSTFQMSKVNAAFATGYNFTDLFIASRGTKDETGPTKLKHVLRSGGVNYASGNIDLPLLAGPQVTQRTINPNTGLPFTYAGLNGIEIGVESAL